MAGLTIALIALAIGAIAVVSALHFDEGVDDVVAIGTIVTVAGVVIAGVVGSVGMLRPLPLVLGACGAGAAGVAVGGLAAIRRWFVRWRAVAGRPSSRPITASTAVLVLLAACGLVWQVVVAQALPTFAYDGLSYRLTMIADWVRHGDLRVSELSVCCARYALSPELLMAWPMTLTHSDELVQLTQVAFVLLGAAATAGLARSAGVDVDGRVAAAAIYATTPWVLAQATATYVDLIIAGWALASLHWIVRYASTGRSAHLTLAAIGIGGTIGAKGVGVLWGVVLVVTAVIVVLRRDGARRRAAWGIARVLAIVTALGGAWYVRNWVQVGNPVAPFEVSLAGRTIFEGATTVADASPVPPGGSRFGAVGEVAFSWLGDLRVWDDVGYDYQQRRGGFGPGWVLIGLPSMILMALWSVRRRAPISIAIVATFVVFAVQPFRWWARFTPVLAALGAVGAVWVLARLTASRARWLGAAMVVAAAWSVAAVGREVRPSGNADPIAAADVVSLIGTPRSERTLQRLVHHEYAFVDLIPDDARVAVDLRTPGLRFVFPLFGPDLDRRVEPVVDGRPPSDEAWVVTGPGRPTDDRMDAATGRRLVVDGQIRVWSPVDA